MFDTNSTGIITVQDLKVGLRALGFEPGKNEIKRLVKNLNRPIISKDNQDKEKQGTISLDFKDFSEIMAMKMSEPAAENELRKAFILFSQEEKAKTLTMEEFKQDDWKQMKKIHITLEDLRMVANMLGETMTDDELREMIFEANKKDRNGTVDIDQFLSILTKKD